MKQIIEKTKEALLSVIPIAVIVLLLSITVIDMPIGTLMLFLSGAALLVIGLGIFNIGVEMSMLPLGEGVGKTLTRSKRSWLMILICLFIGIIVTIAEPDLQVLAEQVKDGIDPSILILTIAIGVGIFLVISLLRTLIGIKLSHLLIALYVLVFVLSIFAPDAFIAVAFDSGGVTTGPVTVPFIISLGVGLASMRSDKHSHNDSFGLIALCSIGPILAVMILSIIYKLNYADFTPVIMPGVETASDVAKEFAVGFPKYTKEVCLALAPIVGLFIIFQLITKKFKRRSLGKVCIGFVYCLIGMIVFLTGANVGFMPAGNIIGQTLASGEYAWLLIPFGMATGFFIVVAEPAVHVLKLQVEEISNGAISARSLQHSLSIGVAISVGLAMVRVLTGISIFWFLIPGYAIALTLSLIVPKMFTAIAFDSGGVASGSMTATFLIPLAMGAATGAGGNILTDAFGIVAMVAMTPLITIQILGLISKHKQAKVEKDIQPTDLSLSLVFYSEDVYEC